MAKTSAAHATRQGYRGRGNENAARRWPAILENVPENEELVTTAAQSSVTSPLHHEE